MLLNISFVSNSLLSNPKFYDSIIIKQAYVAILKINFKSNSTKFQMHLLPKGTMQAFRNPSRFLTVTFWRTYVLIFSMHLFLLSSFISTWPIYLFSLIISRLWCFIFKLYFYYTD